MAAIGPFFPKANQGSALGINGGLGNLGVSVAQFFIPFVITFPLFGAWEGSLKPFRMVKVVLHSFGCKIVP